jgi:hypothetical protein
MAESTILVCDVCGKPAEESVGIRVRRRNLVKDLCGSHIRELLTGARAPKRGRRPGSTGTLEAKRQGGPKTTAKRKTSANGRRRPVRKTTAKRRISTNGRRRVARKTRAASTKR